MGSKRPSILSLIHFYKRHKIFNMIKSAKPIMTLNQFMIRGQVMKQYRDFLRTAKRLPDEYMRKDVLEWVRKDYRNNANIPNSQEDQIKSLLKYGDKMLKELKQNVDLATAS